VKLLHVIPSVGPLRGGPSQIVLDMCARLATAGLDVTLATTNDNGPGHLNVPLETPIQQDGYIIIYFRRTAREYTFSWAITGWLARHSADYDFVHVHAAFSYTATITPILARLRSVPYAVTPHGILGRWGLQARRSLAKRLSIALVERPALNHARFVHATSALEARELQAQGLRAPLEVIHLGIDVPPQDHYPPADREQVFPGQQGRTIVLFLGRFHPKKGLDLLLSALARAAVQQPDLILALAGDGDPSYVAWLRDEVCRLNIEDRVFWMGFLRSEEKHAALAHCDIFALPSYSESFGVSVAEAMLYAKPVLISDQVAIAEVIEAAKAGLVRPCSVESFADGLLQLARNPALRDALGLRAAQLAQEEFSMAVMADRLMHAYERYSATP
jgi:glycosyltransferase involved in cell wall biosynthesis